jgi:radical SAM protein with 4Fe4S-binding SPASM domain
MNRATADQVCEFISTVGKGKIKIEWFGGEPLMNTDIIDYISCRLREKLGDDNVAFSMVSNGSLINSEIIKKMNSKWNIRKIQITLDGTEQEYGRRKKYANSNNYFQTVIKNIIQMADNGIYTSVRLNYDANNLQDILSLIEYLNSFLPRTKYLSVYAYHLYGNSKVQTLDITKQDCWFAVQNALVNAGFLTPLKAFALHQRTTQCSACAVDGFVISPNGELYKCTMAMDDNNAKFGDIWGGITNYSAIEQWCNPSLEERCFKCEFLPICQGGCRASAFSFNYTSETCFVQKEWVDDLLRERVNYLKNASPR